MPSWLQALLDWVAANPELAGVAVFVISAVESLALIGILVPGVLILFAFGAMVGTGVLPLTPLMLWAFAGAVLGDQISFWLGWNLKQKLWRIWPLSRSPEFVHKSERFFKRYGTASVFIGRFVGPVRPIIPAMAGMSAMPPLRFTVVNLCSAAIWSPAYLLPGVVLGASFQVAGAVAAKIGLLMLLVVAGMYLFAWGSGRLLTRMPHALQGLSVSIFTTLLIALVVGLSIQSSQTHMRCSEYQTQISQSAMPQALTIYRHGALTSHELLPLRYQGHINVLLEQAGLAGLSIQPSSQMADFLLWLLPKAELDQLPSGMRLHCYDRSQLVIRHIDENREQSWQLRWWRQPDSNLWLGQVNRLQRYSLLGLANWPSEQPSAVQDITWPLGFQPVPVANSQNWQFSF